MSSPLACSNPQTHVWEPIDRGEFKLWALKFLCIDEPDQLPEVNLAGKDGGMVGKLAVAAFKSTPTGMQGTTAM